MKATLRGVVGLRAGEASRALPVAVSHGLVLATMYVLKPVRNALFLGRFGAEQLPFALILVALVGGVSALLFARISRPTRIQQTILKLFPALAVNLLVFWLLLRHAGNDWLVYLFYVWVNLYGVLATSLIWLLANSLFDAREARRVFGFIGAGGILGAIVGSTVTQWTAEALGTEHLLLLGAVGLLAGCLAAQLPRAAPLPAPQGATQLGSGGALDAIRQSPVLRALVPLAGLGALVSALVDISFNLAVDQAYASTDAKATFFGQFFAILNVVAFLVQLLLTSRIMRGLGVGTALFLLPLALGVGSAASLIAPGLVLLLATKSADGALRHSLHKVATEVLFLPVRADLKQRAKVFLDSTLDSLGSGLGAVLAVVLTSWAGLPSRSLGVASLLGVAGWLLACTWARRAYVEEFRRALEQRELRPESLRVELSDAASLRALLAGLSSENERQVTYSLEVLSVVESPAVVGPMLGLLRHPADEVRRKALITLQGQRPPLAPLDVAPLLLDPSSEVRIEALRYKCLSAGVSVREELAQHLAASDIRQRSAALGCLARHWGEHADSLLTRELIESLLEYGGPEQVVVRREMARALGAVQSPDLVPYRERLSLDGSLEVVRVSMESIGRARDARKIPWLVTQLANRQARAHAQAALSSFGAEALPALEGVLTDPTTSYATYHHVARVLGRIAVQDTVDLLVGLLPRCSPRLRLTLLKSLSRLRVKHPELRFEVPHLERLLPEEAHWHAELRQVQEGLVEPPVSRGEQLLQRALGEKQQDALERAFRLLGLMYSPPDIYNAYVGIVSRNKVLHANAVEFLDNLLDREQMRLMLPLLEFEQWTEARGPFESPGSPDEPRRPTPRDDPARTSDPQGRQDRMIRRAGLGSLEQLAQGADNWLRTCAIFVADPHASPKMKGLIEAATQDPDPIVRETARWVLQRRAEGAPAC